MRLQSGLPTPLRSPPIHDCHVFGPAGGFGFQFRLPPPDQLLVLRSFGLSTGALGGRFMFGRVEGASPAPVVAGAAAMALTTDGLVTFDANPDGIGTAVAHGGAGRWAWALGEAGVADRDVWNLGWAHDPELWRCARIRHHHVLVSGDRGVALPVSRRNRVRTRIAAVWTSHGGDNTRIEKMRGPE